MYQLVKFKGNNGIGMVLDTFNGHTSSPKIDAKFEQIVLLPMGVVLSSMVGGSLGSNLNK